MDLSKESLLNLNWSDLSWFQHFNTVLNEETALAYFCQVGNPFYDRSSLNEQIYMSNLPAEAMLHATGIEYALIHRQDPILFIIRKHLREGPNEYYLCKDITFDFHTGSLPYLIGVVSNVRPLQEYYIIAPGHIYQAPDAAAVISHRLLTAVHHFGKAFDEASQKAAYHPSSGYYWKSNGSSDEITKKDPSKDKVLTHTQRVRFDTIFTNYHDRFRPRVPAGTTTQTAITSSTTTNETASATAIGGGGGGGGGDNNLQRKEERTPSDSQSTTTERPMIEVKKQKTQK